MSIYRLDVSCTMGYKQACELRKYLNEKYGANATILKIEENFFSKKKTNNCGKCGNKLNENQLCGFHSKPICTNCNACIDCFNGVDTI